MIFNVGSSGASSADKVKYNNTESGLQSDNVQGAIDEVNNSLDNKIGKIDYSNPIDITNNQAVSKDGLVVAESNGASNQYLGIVINDNGIASVITGNNSYGAVCNALVSKGDVIKVNCYGSSIKSIKLYPYK